MISGYAAYRNSGVPWLGDVPSHWEVRRGRTLTTLQRRPPREGDGVVTAFRDGEVTLRSNRRTEGFTEALQEIGYQGVRVGDLVIHSMDAFAGAIGVSDSDGKMSPVVHIYRAEAADANYLAHALRVASRRGFIQSLAKGIRERSTAFDKATFKDMPLPVPPFGEQRAIADYLDRETAKIDTLIEEQQRLVDMLHERRQALISRSANFVGVRVPSVSLLLDGLRDGTHGSFSRVDASSGRPLLGARNISRGRLVLDGSESRISDEDHMEIVSNGFPRHGDVLLVIVGATIGKAAVFDHGEPLSFQRSVAFLRPRRDVDSRFLWYQIQGDRFQDELRLRSKVSAQPGIYLSDLAAIPVFRPTLEEQRRIVAYLDEQTLKIDTLIGETERFIELSQERRAALITAAVTGQIDVRDHVDVGVA